jgi:hypothetical protein
LIDELLTLKPCADRGQGENAIRFTLTIPEKSIQKVQASSLSKSCDMSGILKQI